jgi:hypothetical protein
MAKGGMAARHTVALEMARAGVIGLIAVLALSPAACGGGDDGAATAAEEPATTAAAEPITVELEEANSSGYSGTATLTPNDEGAIATYQAVVTVEPSSENPQLAAIHEVLCTDYDPEIPADATLDEIFDAASATVADELGEVRDGTLTATAAGSLTERTTGDYSLIVHDNAPPYSPVACGDIPAS